MRSILPAAFAALTLIIGTAAHNAANATVNAHQERMADALCTADPAWCGQRR